MQSISKFAAWALVIFVAISFLAEAVASGLIIYLILGGILIALCALAVDYFSPEKAAERQRVDAEEKRKKRLEEKQRFTDYRELRKEIGLMPKYQTWRSDVLEKDGGRCIQCGSITKLEVDHIKSFYRIIQSNNIDNVAKAAECVDLWDLRNGRVLCKICHDKTPTSERRRLHGFLDSLEELISAEPK